MIHLSDMVPDDAVEDARYTALWGLLVGEK